MPIKSIVTRWLAVFGSLVFAANAAFAQDSKALIDALVRKGILTDAAAQQIANEVKAAQTAQSVSTSGGRYLSKVSISGRFHVQYAGLSTEVDGAASQPASTNHVFLRRVYVGVKADLGNGWTSNLNYDFAGSTFDAAYVEWKKSDALAIDVGFRKVPFGLEEWYTSSSNLRAIERSPGTRYFVEGNNGRRLGAGSYRTGVFLGGKTQDGVFYNVALTNPERDESASGVTGQGSASTNTLAYWGNLGYVGSTSGGSYTMSSSVGFLPDQGGKTLGAGNDLTVYNLFGQYTSGPFDLQLEYFGSNNDHGTSATQNASSYAWSVQPAVKVTDLAELVLRYSYVDSDGRGLSTSDLIRSAPSGGTMDKLSELFAGVNLYFRGNDAKWQIGYIHGESKDTITGAQAKATTDGFRSMMQLNY